MTLVSSFFAEQGSCSFSQLLAGAMASPMAPNSGFLFGGKREKGGNSCDDGKNSESGGGYKRNRPMNLVVAQPQLQMESLSPLFMVPQGLSPSGLLNSPGFLSPFSVGVGNWSPGIREELFPFNFKSNFHEHGSIWNLGLLPKDCVQCSDGGI
ncbi:UNVERIFIED_CONTAM: putative WRKY transcription factor 3 [Sesamum radiatum]|uniref:WRKY transcription factor 3 n=1 Tax=Sesamum radiatum TaxID=300843 RepID=A0AAW2P7R2_SESRA